MTRNEIEAKQYAARMRLRSIEAGFDRVDPYSPEFEDLLHHSFTVQQELRDLLIEWTKISCGISALEES